MSRLSIFDSPFLLGFDQFERALDRVSKASTEGYPPYNIEQVGEDRLRITLAVAGFSADGLSVQLEDNQLRQLWWAGQWQGDRFVAIAPADRPGAAKPVVPKPQW